MNMTDRAQFEAMLEALINEDQETAKEIFHNIVVAKSREIYEELLSEDFGQEEEEEEGMEEEGVEDDADDDTETDAEDDADDDTETDADAEEDDFGGEEEDDFGDEEGGDEGLEDRVMDLEDALEDLKAEFEQLLAGEEAEGHDMGGMDDMGDDDMGGMDDMGADLDSELEADEEMMPMMEYKNLVKVAPAKMGDDGVNNKSAVAGKNDMGGTTANMTKSFSTTSGGTKGGLSAPTPKDMNTGNINTVPGKAGKAFSTRVPAGHGAEKKGASEKADNKNSMLNGAPKRAK
jgi:hypothetical protein